MALAKLGGASKAKILRLMERSSRAMGLRLCFHDRLVRSGLPQEWRIHVLAPCMEAKSIDNKRCVDFAMGEVPRALAGNPAGRIHTCPWGYTEIAVPVSCEGERAGVLFAGVCWTGRGRPKHPGLIRPPARAWLEDRLQLLKAVATELGELLRGERAWSPPDRRARILELLWQRADRPVEMADLAEELELSASRTGHLVRELFGMTFPGLVRSVKMREAAERLSATRLPVTEVAGLVGYDDPNYFSRLFSAEFGMPPREYRKRYSVEA